MARIRRSIRSAARLGIPEGAAVVGIVANYRPVKDLPLFLRAAKIVKENVPHAAFLLVGKGESLAELTDLARELNIANSVFFTNGEGDVRDHLASMSIACLSSVSEGFSNAILEYMASGLPVIATAVGGNGEAILEGQTGYLVRERTPEAFAAPIIRLLQNEDLRRQMASNSLHAGPGTVFYGWFCCPVGTILRAVGRVEGWLRLTISVRRQR